MTELLGLIAAACTTFCYVPQALHVIRERNTAGISLLAYSVLFIGILLWCIYGFLRSDLPLIAANMVSLPLVGTVLFMKLRLRS